jgi:hypothetical protein
MTYLKIKLKLVSPRYILQIILNYRLVTKQNLNAYMCNPSHACQYFVDSILLHSGSRSHLILREEYDVWCASCATSSVSLLLPLLDKNILVSPLQRISRNPQFMFNPYGKDPSFTPIYKDTQIAILHIFVFSYLYGRSKDQIF